MEGRIWKLNQTIFCKKEIYPNTKIQVYKLAVLLAVPPAPVRAHSQKSLAPSVTSVANDKRDNEMVPDDVHRPYSWGKSRISWSIIYYCWFSICINLFYSYRISWPPCYYWNNFSSNLFNTAYIFTFFI
jgi:hypothetical protein